MFKQVIVLRKDLNMRKGKAVSQGAHASLTAYRRAGLEARREWENTGQTKICVSVDTEEQLLNVYKDANNAELPVALIKDAGRTEFKEPTYTSVCIGPARSEEIDKITGQLKLL